MGLAGVVHHTGQLTPSPNTKNRSQSFAQKLRSTSKSVKGKLGYTNLNETTSSPLRDSPTTSVSEPPPPSQLQPQSSVPPQMLQHLGSTSISSAGYHPTSMLLPGGTLKSGLPLESKVSLNGACAASVSGDYNTTTISKYGYNGITSCIIETPSCWRTIYHLLELYGTMPETKTIQHRLAIPSDKKHLPFHRQDTRNEDDEVASAPTPLPQHKDALGKR